MSLHLTLSRGARAIAVSLAALAASAAAEAQNTETTGAEMVLLEGSRLDEVWVRAGGVDLARYGAIYLAPIQVSYKDSRPEYELDEEQVERLDEVVREELAQSLAGAGGYALVEEPGAGVLEIRGEIAELDINASDNFGRPGVEVHPKNIGSMTLRAVLRDGGTGENLILVRDHVEGRDQRIFIATPNTYWFGFRNAVADWSDTLRHRLDEAQFATLAAIE